MGEVVPLQAVVVIQFFGVDLVPVVQWTILIVAIWMAEKVLDNAWARARRARTSEGRRFSRNCPGEALAREYSRSRNPQSTGRR